MRIVHRYWMSSNRISASTFVDAFFYFIGNFYKAKKYDAHAKAMYMLHECDAFAAREYAVAHSLFLQVF